jgi:heptaprenyl diphosphate synthase
MPPAHGLALEGLGQVEAALAREIDRLPAPLARPCARVAGAGGKRLRPALVLAAAAAVGVPASPHVVDAGVAVELLHLATLVHDDLLEGASTRRGAPTINAGEGPAMALLAGDVLIGAATRLATSLSAEAGLLVQQTLVELCAGQALEEEARFRLDLTDQGALDIAEGKTGSLLGAACRLGALLAPAGDGDQAAVLAGFGRAFGTCLQLLDDLLDLLSSQALFGKPVGVDFAAGTVTLPAVHALAVEPELRHLLRPGLSDVERQRALVLLRCCGGIPAALRCAVEHADRAQVLLEGAGAAADPGVLARLAAMPQHYLTRQLDLVLPEHRHLLGDLTPGTAPGLGVLASSR